MPPVTEVSEAGSKAEPLPLSGRKRSTPLSPQEKALGSSLLGELG